MTDEELAAIKARAEAATPGPWHVFRKWRVEVWDANDDQVADIGYLGDADDDQRQMMASDGAFIAHARADIPALLAEVEAWRAVGRQMTGADAPNGVDLRAQARALLGMASEGERLMAERKQGLDDITQLNQEMGLYDAPQGAGEGEASEPPAVHEMPYGRWECVTNCQACGAPMTASGILAPGHDNPTPFYVRCEACGRSYIVTMGKVEAQS